MSAPRGGARGGARGRGAGGPPNRGGSGAKGGAGARGGSAPQGRRDQAVDKPFRLNQIQLDIAGLVENLPVSYAVIPCYRDEQRSNINDLKLEPREEKFLQKKVKTKLGEAFPGEYCFDDQNRVYTNSECKGNFFEVQIGPRDKVETVSFEITKIDTRADLNNKAAIESLINNVVRQILNDTQGRVVRNSLYPLDDDCKFSKAVKSVTATIEKQLERDSDDLKPFKTCRGFQPKVSLMYKDKPTKGAHVLDEIKDGKIGAYMSVSIKAGCELTKEMKFPEFEAMAKNGCAAGRAGSINEVMMDSVMAQLFIKRTYLDRDYAEPCSGLDYRRTSGNTTFLKDGKTVTVLEHFKSRGPQFQNLDPNGPTVYLRERGGKTSDIPGSLVVIPPQIISPFGTELQGKTTNLSRTNVRDYTVLCESFLEHFFVTNSKKLDGWGIKAFDKMLKLGLFPGFESEDPRVVYAGAGTPEVKRGMWNLRNLKLYSPAIKHRKICVLDLFGESNAMQSFLQLFEECHKKLGMDVKLVPRSCRLALPNRADFCKVTDFTKAEEGLRPHREAIAKEFDGCYVILPKFHTDEVYNVVKFVFETSGITTQCMKLQKTPVLNGRALRGSPDQHFSNIIAGYNVKAKGRNHVLSPAGYSKVLPKSVDTNGLMVIGIDLQHGQIRDQNGKFMRKLSTASMVASYEGSLTQCYSAGWVQAYVEDLIEPSGTRNMINSIMDRVTSETKIKHVIIVRDGIDEGSYDVFRKDEVGIIVEGIERVQKVKPEVTVVVCMKRHPIRILPSEPSANENVSPGTICAISKESRGIQADKSNIHFYLMGHHAIPGSTAVPIRVGILENPGKLPPWVFGQMMYWFQHLDQVVQKTVSLPFAGLYAHKGAERVSRIVKCLGAKKIYNFDEVNKELEKHCSQMPNCAFL